MMIITMTTTCNGYAALLYVVILVDDVDDVDHVCSFLAYSVSVLSMRTPLNLALPKLVLGWVMQQLLDPKVKEAVCSIPMLPLFFFAFFFPSLVRCILFLCVC